MRPLAPGHHGFRVEHKEHKESAAAGWRLRCHSGKGLSYLRGGVRRRYCFFLCVFFFVIFGMGLSGFLTVVAINIKAQKVLGVNDIVKPLYSNLL